MIALVALVVGCGEGWTPVMEDAPEGAFLSVWGASEHDVWIVGGQPDSGVVLRGSGRDWRRQELPAGVPLLNWVHGTGPDDIWVAGLHGALLHHDGAVWTDHSLDVDEALWGVFALSADQAWAVGGTSRWGGERAVARSFDGSVWSELALPPEFVDLDNLFKVHHDGDVPWLVGAGGAALRWDGERFAPAATGTAADLVTANRAEPGERMVVVGGRGTGVVLTAGEQRLTVRAQAPAGLNGVHTYGGVAVVVGESGATGEFDLQTDVLVMAEPVTFDVLHATWGTPGGTMYAVGGNLATAADVFHGVVLTAPAPEAR